MDSNLNPNLRTYGWRKGETGNPNGRPKKVATVLGKIGYTQAQIRDVIKQFLNSKMEELESVLENEDASILERTISHALLKGYERADLSAFALLGNIAYPGESGILEEMNLNDPIEMIIKRNKNTPKLARGEDEIED
jgi:hypothetical protein